jgi:Holliday junction resolvase RusA-like endonuclease
MRVIRHFIPGVPYGPDKVRGNTKAPERWKAAIKQHTSNLPLVRGPCLLRVTFLLPPNKFPRDHPYGSDLDNLLKLFGDALQETVLREAPGKDGAIVSVEAAKAKVASEAESGAQFEIIDYGDVS